MRKSDLSSSLRIVRSANRSLRGNPPTKRLEPIEVAESLLVQKHKPFIDGLHRATYLTIKKKKCDSKETKSIFTAKDQKDLESSLISMFVAIQKHPSLNSNSSEDSIWSAAITMIAIVSDKVKS